MSSWWYSEYLKIFPVASTICITILESPTRAVTPIVFNELNKKCGFTWALNAAIWAATTMLLCCSFTSFSSASCFSNIAWFWISSIDCFIFSFIRFAVCVISVSSRYAVSFRSGVSHSLDARWLKYSVIWFNASLVTAENLVNATAVSATLKPNANATISIPLAIFSAPVSYSALA